MTEEQAKALQEKLKNMSPEELKEFQKKQCIFCQIIDGKVSSKKIYEDDICVAVLDINPANPGHLLLMPKEHYQIMPMIPDEELAHLSMVAKALSHAMLKVLKAEGTDIFIANGIAAGQRAQHFMVHIIPRKQGDKLPLDIPQKDLSPEEISAVKKVVQEKINTIFKIKKSAVEIEEKEPIKEETEAEKEEKEIEELETIEKKDVKKEKKPKKKSVKKKAEKKQPNQKSKSESDSSQKKKKKPKKNESEEGGIGLDDIARLLK
ncbi:HIT domain-containing protein [Candidatus Woesearchaeota archaeon]|nr:HIT domain-containing protein [Candidatus Woesearchaeota archaeon]